MGETFSGLKDDGDGVSVAEGKGDAGWLSVGGTEAPGVVETEPGVG